VRYYLSVRKSELLEEQQIDSPNTDFKINQINIGVKPNLTSALV